MEQSRLDVAIRRRLASWAIQVHAAATSIRRLRRELEAFGVHQGSTLVESTANRVDDLGAYLENADVEQLVHDLRSYAREHPAIVVAGAAGVGFATARLVKAGSK